MSFDDIKFEISEEVLELGVNGASFAFAGLNNRQADPDFDSFRDRELAYIKDNLTEDKIRTDPIVAGYRALHDAVGVSNKKNISSTESMLGYLLRTGRMPHVNLLVDIYNLVSLQTRLSLGAHDISRVDGNIYLRMTIGDERFVPLGKDLPVPVPAGIYAYIDDSKDILCKLEVRQAEKTKTTLQTTDCFFMVQGNPAADIKYIRESTETLIALIKRYCGGREKMLYVPW